MQKLNLKLTSELNTRNCRMQDFKVIHTNCQQHYISGIYDINRRRKFKYTQMFMQCMKLEVEGGVEFDGVPPLQAAPRRTLKARSEVKLRS